MHKSRLGVLITGLLALLLVLGACEADDDPDVAAPDDDDEEPADEPETDDDWPGDSLENVIAASPGGAQDGLIRGVEPYFEEAFGTPLDIQYQPGGGTAIGTGVVANSGQACEPVLFNFIPGLLFGFLTQDVHFTYDDFAAAGRLSYQPSALLVADDAEWDTMEDFVEDARDRPGEITVSVPFLTSGDTLAMVGLQDAEDIDLNVVPFDGGGPARTALLGGEVDATAGAMFAAHEIADEARYLGVFVDGENPEPELTGDAPPVDEALGTDIGNIGADGFGWFVHQECADEHPERHERLAEAIEEAAANEEYLDELGEVSGQIDHLGPEEFDEFTETQLEFAEEMLEAYPEEFAGAE